MPKELATEGSNPASTDLDLLSTIEFVRLVNSEDAKLAGAVAEQAESIARAIDLITARLQSGGRLIYVGAGTSGRLGVLDASECPPTFGSDPDDVQGIMAGGTDALMRSREGVEDDREAGADAIGEAHVGPADYVLGIASSGTTPFVHAALEAARDAGAGTGLLSCTPPPEDMARRVDHTITTLTGPEAIAGSTRMKAGTATKLVLNTISTGVMIQLGKVYGNLMVDLRAVSRKLVDRSLRMVSAVTGLEREEARQLLISAGGSVKTAIAMHETRVGRFTAERRLDVCDGFLAHMVHRFPPGSPVRDFAEFPAGFGRDWDRLIDRLARAPAALEAAASRSLDEDGAPTVGRTHEDISWQLDHLARYEREAIRPRVETWPVKEILDFEDWEDDSEAGPEDAGADFGARIEVFRNERERTVAALRAAGPGFLERTGRQGAEQFSAYQFLRATAQHDDAHVARIGERLHRSLVEDGE